MVTIVLLITYQPKTTYYQPNPNPTKHRFLLSTKSDTHSWSLTLTLHFVTGIYLPIINLELKEDLKVDLFVAELQRGAAVV